MDGHSPASPWPAPGPLDVQAGDTARRADSEFVSEGSLVLTVGASTPDILSLGSGNCRSPNVALEAQAGPVVVEAQTEPVRLPSPPPNVPAWRHSHCGRR